MRKSEIAAVFVPFIIIIVCLVLIIIYRENEIKKWQDRAFKTQELYQNVCTKYNERPVYVP